MNTAQAKQRFTIEDVIRHIGAVETKASAGRREIWFLSPWRDEETASFKVDTAKQTWFDHGGGEDQGGDMIKLVQRHLEKDGGLATVSEALKWFDSLGGSVPTQKSKQPITAPLKRKVEISRKADPKFILVKEKNINHPALVNYIVNERRLSLDVVQRYCSEIHFKAKGASKSKKPLFGFGMMNDAGAWEVRGAIGNFKAVIEGEKSITTLYGNNIGKPDVLDVMEGNPDFLTKELLWPMKENEAIIILNGAKLVHKAINKIKTEPRLQEIKLTRFWTQNDDTGQQILNIFLDELHNRMPIGCMAKNYHDFKDLNKWWTDSPTAQSIQPRKTPALKQYYDAAWNQIQNLRSTTPRHRQP